MRGFASPPWIIQARVAQCAGIAAGVNFLRYGLNLTPMGVSPAAFLAHPPDLQPWPLMDMDFATSCPLVRPVLPRIRLLFVRSRFRSTLPSDGPSRFRPCASLVLHLHQVAQRTFTPRLLDMPSTQDAARRRLAPGPLAASWTTLARGALHQAGRNKGRVNPRDFGSLRGCGRTIVGVE